jgi:hypothetical protein
LKSQRLRIIVGGMVAKFPLGGVAWDYLHYVLAFHELGHEVFYHEDTNTWPYDPLRGEPTPDGAYAAGFIDAFFVRYCPELRQRWHFNLLSKQSYGLSREHFQEIAASADVYLNVSGSCILPDNLGPRCKRVFVDTDPGFNQIGLYSQLQENGSNCQRYREVTNHDVFLTYAENINSPDCHLPRLGLQWIPTRPLVTPSQWDWCRTAKPKEKLFTTVMTLDFSAEFKGLRYEGTTYGDKRTEFEKFIDLPSRTEACFTLAVGRHSGLERIQKKGWQVTPAPAVSATPERYQQFIAESYGEWSIAKNIYAAPRTGWFSTRTCCYLAAGRPAILQDTTWSRFIPSGEGLIAFNTLDQAVSALDNVMSNYERHQQAACDIAREYFSPNAVLKPALEHIITA